MKKEPNEIRIYDPYFCNGSVKEHLGERGFSSVYNRNEDFYEMIAKNKCPPFDVIVTNPPYSADHVDAMFKFCVVSGTKYAGTTIHDGDTHARIYAGVWQTVVRSPAKLLLHQGILQTNLI